MKNRTFAQKLHQTIFMNNRKIIDSGNIKCMAHTCEFLWLPSEIKNVRLDQNTESDKSAYRL